MIIAQGAEATIKKEKNTIIKDRIKKSYRHPELDNELRMQRTRREAKILEKLSKSLPVPKILAKTDTTLTLEYLDGKKLRDTLHLHPLKYGRELGKLLTKLHNLNIIHGDLTTSNIIVTKHLNLIDFGLSTTSTKVEDRAVDLHVLKESLESKHYKIANKVFLAVLSEYHPKDEQEVLNRLKTVELRGRNK